LIALPKYLFSGIDVFALMAVPFFILTAELMTGGALSGGAAALRLAVRGTFPGRTGPHQHPDDHLLLGISGSALADAAGPGAIMIRMMRNDGYHPEYAAALTAAVSILGPIIPPSISMIIYALAYPEINLVGLMIAGVLPGILIAIAMAVINHVVSVRRNYRGVVQHLALRDYLRNTWRALPALVPAGVDPRRHRVRRVYADRGERGCRVLRARCRSLDLRIAAMANAARRSCPARR
jgi:TRAP-type C4-dicarboxylate transport system permease large subunit